MNSLATALFLFFKDDLSEINFNNPYFSPKFALPIVIGNKLP